MKSFNKNLILVLLSFTALFACKQIQTESDLELPDENMDLLYADFEEKLGDYCVECEGFFTFSVLDTTATPYHYDEVRVDSIFSDTLNIQFNEMPFIESSEIFYKMTDESKFINANLVNYWSGDFLLDVEGDSISYESTISFYCKCTNAWLDIKEDSVFYEVGSFADGIDPFRYRCTGVKKN